MFFAQDRRLCGSSDSLKRRRVDSRVKVGRIIASKGNEITEREKKHEGGKVSSARISRLAPTSRTLSVHVAAQRCTPTFRRDGSEANLFVFLSRLSARRAHTMFTGHSIPACSFGGTCPPAPSTSFCEHRGEQHVKRIKNAGC